MIYTASFYDPQDWVGKAYRVSRAHPRGRKAQWDTLPFLYPPRELLTAYRASEIDFEAFVTEYRRGLDTGYLERTQFRDWIKNIPTLGDFTLLCFERGAKECHRRPLAQWLLERAPSVKPGELR